MMVTLALPAFNEAQALSLLIPQARSLGLGVWVVDDGSSDGTAELAASLGAEVRRHPQNQGLAAALRTLFLWALEDPPADALLATMDADATMSPAQIPTMARLSILEDLDVVVASRYQPGAVVRGVPPHRLLFSWGARALFSLLKPVPGLSDYTSGFRLYRVEALKVLHREYPPLFDSLGFAAQTEMALRLARLGMRFGEVPIELDYSRRGCSRMHLGPALREYLRLVLSDL